MADNIDFQDLFAQVDCVFPNGAFPYTSASSPDKPRWHVWDMRDHQWVMFESEDDMLGGIIERHHQIAERLSQHLKSKNCN